MNSNINWSAIWAKQVKQSLVWSVVIGALFGLIQSAGWRSTNIFDPISAFFVSSIFYATIAFIISIFCISLGVAIGYLCNKPKDPKS